MKDKYLNLHRDRFEVGFILLAVQLTNYFVGHQIIKSSVLPQEINIFILNLEHILNIIFCIVFISVLISLELKKILLARYLIKSYTTIVTLQLIYNVLFLVISAHEKKGQPLYLLWDVAIMYIMNVIIFAVWYWIMDTSSEKGAFLFPDKEEGKSVHLLDYLFISFNTNTTFGPTTEVIRSKTVKVLMMIQTAISLMITLVLAARAVGHQ